VTAKPTPSIVHHFSSITDPIVNRQKKHHLQDIFFISLCAMICGADNWGAAEEFGLAKEEWFTELLGLEHGIPSHDAFGGVYAAIDADHFSVCFSRWVADLASLTEGQVIAIDGKRLEAQLGQGPKKSRHT
jgi:DDE_Tnp_1-associated